MKHRLKRRSASAARAAHTRVQAWLLSALITSLMVMLSTPSLRTKDIERIIIGLGKLNLWKDSRVWDACREQRQHGQHRPAMDVSYFTAFGAILDRQLQVRPKNVPYVTHVNVMALDVSYSYVVPGR